MKIKENYLNIQKDVPNALIVAVSKYVGAEEIIEAYQSGIRNFGENKIQDAQKKRAEIPKEIDDDIKWHFLGHLQTNKADKAIGNYEYIHSVDSVKIAKILSESAKSKEIIQKILIQVNIGEEKTKYGFTANEIKDCFKEIFDLDSLEIVGLMTMAPFTQNEKQQREVFKGLSTLKYSLQNEYKINIPELSMGMSNDYKTAYEEGSTIIRIGQAIFNSKKVN